MRAVIVFIAQALVACSLLCLLILWFPVCLPSPTAAHCGEGLCWASIHSSGSKPWTWHTVGITQASAIPSLSYLHPGHVGRLQVGLLSAFPGGSPGPCSSPLEPLCTLMMVTAWYPWVMNLGRLRGQGTSEGDREAKDTQACLVVSLSLQLCHLLLHSWARLYWRDGSNEQEL